VLGTGFSPWPDYTEDEAAAVLRVLRSNRVNYWTGTECREFEKEFAAWSGSRYAVSLANGTLALDVALKALGIGPGDDVIVAPRTYIASASCVVTAGARPVFVDVDRDSQNMSAETIENSLTPATRAVICVHLAGMPCDMDPIMRLARQRGLFVIEDCAQAHGALYKGRSVGSIGDIGAWSFCQDKIITTGGEGGMVTTNDQALWSRMWSYKDHGKSWDAVYNRTHPPGFRWVHESIGTNWRMLEVQAAIGRLQLRRMQEWTARRARNASRLRAACEPYPVVRVPAVPDDVVHANYRFYAFVRSEHLAEGWSRDRIVHEVASAGVPCLHGSCSEVYFEKAFEGAGMRPQSRLPVAKELGETSIAMLVHPTLSDAEIQRSAEVLGTVLAQACSDGERRSAAGR
jgi:dTDP-4-amino-4,6-dideoxygalactose transaminase